MKYELLTENIQARSCHTAAAAVPADILAVVHTAEAAAAPHTLHTVVEVVVCQPVSISHSLTSHLRAERHTVYSTAEVGDSFLAVEDRSHLRRCSLGLGSRTYFSPYVGL